MQSDNKQASEKRYRVLCVKYGVHTKRGAEKDAPRTLRVDYKVSVSKWVSEWICFEHVGFPRSNAKKWWRRRTKISVPQKADRALRFINSAGIASARFITVRYIPGNPFPKIIGYVLKPAPSKCPHPFTAVDEGGVK